MIGGGGAQWPSGRASDSRVRRFGGSNVLAIFHGGLGNLFYKVIVSLTGLNHQLVMINTD